MKIEKNTMNASLLKYLVLSTGLHADALECHVAENREVIHQLQFDAKRMNDLEQQLESAVAAAKRIGAVGGVLLAARSAREAQGAKTSSTSSQPQVRWTPSSGIGQSVGDALKFASLATDFSVDSSPVEASQVIANAEANVTRIRHAMMLAENNSVELKLRKLEALKAQVGKAPSREELLAASASFCFSPEVEKLWSTKRVTAPSCEKGPDGGDNDDDSEIGADSSESSYFVSLVHGAVERFKRRYLDAISVLRLVESDEALGAMTSAEAETLDVAAAKRLCSASLYAQQLSNPQMNADLRTVLALENADSQTLASHYDDMCERYWTRGPDVLLQRSTRSTSSSDSMIGATPAFFLPKEWQCASALQASLQSETLPPARHILCNRFSFADLQELQSLEMLRVEVQAKILNSVLFSGDDGSDEVGKVDDEAFGTSNRRQWVRDAADAKIALALRSICNETSTSNISWPVLARKDDSDSNA